MTTTPKILLVLAKRADWTYPYDYSMKMFGMKGLLPPMGLCTLAGQLPESWDLKLVDMNVRPLKDSEIDWADYVFISAIIGQEQSLIETSKRVRSRGRKVVVGGSLMNSSAFRFEHEDCFDVRCIGEFESYGPELIKDLEAGKLKPRYVATEKAEFSKLNLKPPRWDLLPKNFRMLYASPGLEMSRGCPFDCEFCDIINVFGRSPRYKTKEQVVAELDALKKIGWEGIITITDDNFIGRRNTAHELLTAIIDWQEKNNNYFGFAVVTTINIADEPELMEMFLKAGVRTIYVGIETPNPEALKETHKLINMTGSLEEKAKRLQAAGFDLMAGMICGFDSDGDATFEMIKNFIAETRIPWPYFQTLQVIDNTALFDRMRKEGRLIDGMAHGHRVDLKTGQTYRGYETGRTNFVPKMGAKKLQEGYGAAIDVLFGPKYMYHLAEHVLRLGEASSKTANIMKPRLNVLNVVTVMVNLMFGIDRWAMFTEGLRVLRKGGWWRFWKFYQVANVGCGFAFHYRRVRKLIKQFPVTEQEVVETKVLPAMAPAAMAMTAGLPNASPSRLQVVS